MKRIEVFRINNHDPIVYYHKDHPSLTIGLKEGCLIISEAKGALLILPITQLRNLYQL